MKRNTFLVLALGCLVWQAQRFEGLNAFRDAGNFFNSLPRTAMDAHMVGAGSSAMEWYVTWAEPCGETPHQTQAPQTAAPQAAPKPTPDWHGFPTKYRKYGKTLKASERVIK